jgi:hypothetical protein
MRLAELGERICVLGPSNSGKSTLAVAIARKTGLPAVHLDRLHHVPGTDWKVRPAEEFVALHEAAIAGELWVMDGNYSRLFARRFERATGIIVLGYLDGGEFVPVCGAERFEERESGRAGGWEGQRQAQHAAPHCGGDAGEPEALCGGVPGG